MDYPAGIAFAGPQAHQKGPAATRSDRLDIVRADEDVVVAHRPRLLIVVWRGAARGRFPDEIHGWVAEQKRRENGADFAMVGIYESTTEAPNAPLRARWAESMKRCDPALRFMVNCLPVTGFKAAMMRTVFSAINLITKAPFEAIVASSTALAAEHVSWP